MYEGRDTRFGSKVPVTCNDGYKLSGDDHITCASDGTWTKATQCVIQGLNDDNLSSSFRPIKTQCPS